MNGRKINSLGIWGNTDKPKFWQLLDPLIKWANQNKIETYITTRIKDKTKEVLPENIRIIEKADDFLKTDFLLFLPLLNILNIQKYIPSSFFLKQSKNCS